MTTIRDKGSLPEGDALAEAVTDFKAGFQPTSTGESVTMAGGQERILRRRIKSVQSTKKITRAMELIAASRIVKAQARVQAAQPYADGITEVVRDLQAAGAGANNPLLVPRAETRRVGEVVIAADRGLCGALQLERDPRRRGRHPRRSRRRVARPRSSPSAASPRATSGSATTRSSASFGGFTAEPHVRRRARGRGGGRSARSKPASSTSCSSPTRSSSPPAARKS